MEWSCEKYGAGTTPVNMTTVHADGSKCTFPSCCPEANFKTCIANKRRCFSGGISVATSPLRDPGWSFGDRAVPFTYRVVRTGKPVVAWIGIAPGTYDIAVSKTNVSDWTDLQQHPAYVSTVVTRDLSSVDKAMTMAVQGDGTNMFGFEEILLPLQDQFPNTYGYFNVTMPVLDASRPDQNCVPLLVKAGGVDSINNGTSDAFQRANLKGSMSDAEIEASINRTAQVHVIMLFDADGYIIGAVNEANAYGDVQMSCTAYNKRLERTLAKQAHFNDGSTDPNQHPAGSSNTGTAHAPLPSSSGGSAADIPPVPKLPVSKIPPEKPPVVPQPDPVKDTGAAPSTATADGTGGKPVAVPDPLNNSNSGSKSGDGNVPSDSAGSDKPNPDDDKKKGGYSTGAKVAIGLTVAGGAAALLYLVVRSMRGRPSSVPVAYAPPYAPPYAAPYAPAPVATPLVRAVQPAYAPVYAQPF